MGVGEGRGGGGRRGTRNGGRGWGEGLGAGAGGVEGVRVRKEVDNVQFSLPTPDKIVAKAQSVL